MSTLNDRANYPQVELDESGVLTCHYAGRSYALSSHQVRILYALAESDYGWLTLPALHELLFQLQRHHHQERSPTPEQLQQVNQHLPHLVEQDLVVVSSPSAGALLQSRIQQTESSLALITFLTRSWSSWSEYSQAHGLFHF